MRRKKMKIWWWARILALLMAIWFLRSWPATMAGKKALERRELGSAVSWFEFATRIHPNPTNFYRLARVKRLRGDGAGMRKALDAAVRRGLQESESERQLTMWKAQQGRLLEAEIALSGLLLDQRDERDDICESYIRGFVRQHRVFDASRLVQLWWNDSMPSPLLLTLRGHVSREDGDLVSAEADYRWALRLAPSFDEASFALGQLLLRTRRPLPAIEHLRRATGHSVLRGEALLEKARAERLVGRIQAAEQTLNALRETLVKRPDSAVRLALKLESALVAERKGDFERAESILRQRLVEFSGDYRFQEALGRLLQTKGKPSEALEFLQTAALQQRRLSIAHAQSVQPRPEDEARRRYRIAACYLDNGMREDATSWLRSVLCYAPDHKQAQRDLAKITGGSGAL